MFRVSQFVSFHFQLNVLPPILIFQKREIFTFSFTNTLSLSTFGHFFCPLICWVVPVLYFRFELPCPKICIHHAYNIAGSE